MAISKIYIFQRCKVRILKNVSKDKILGCVILSIIAYLFFESFLKKKLSTDL